MKDFVMAHPWLTVFLALAALCFVDNWVIAAINAAKARRTK